ncbi:transaldolase [Cytophagaceae bacterium YF14B1]|uniref:Transaldolase n=1 Tax=Xanthocytophaga flava TaxID=3048013 RepID=A0AAE3QRV5_9BACT|nr:transaldolase [Xanthocytophaga flavus]MDJ1481689.1 transaldolase [Xanthocytophaga flavus]
MKKNTLNPLVQVNELGQSIWLDFINRQLLRDGNLQQLIDEDGLRGMTSNPAIFEKAMTGSNEYDDDIRQLTQQEHTTKEIYEAMAVADVQRACDAFLPVYNDPDNNRTDGYVSLEVAPTLVHDTQGTIEEGRRLWKAVNRPNLMIKVPGTEEGLPAIQTLLTEGINVNVTLLFSVERYRAVAETYIAALAARAASGKPIDGISSVASFFLSRIDLLLDPLLEKIVQSGGEKGALAQEMLGQVAIASAKTAYRVYKEVFSSMRFQELMDKGAATQRLLWASTGNKNPLYSPLKYVESLIGPKTVNTVPLETLQIYRADGKPVIRLEDNLEQAESLLARLPELGIDLETIAAQLEQEGIYKFNDPFEKLMKGLEEKREQFATQTAGL